MHERGLLVTYYTRACNKSIEEAHLAYKKEIQRRVTQARRRPKPNRTRPLKKTKYKRVENIA